MRAEWLLAPLIVFDTNTTGMCGSILADRWNSWLSGRLTRILIRLELHGADSHLLPLDLLRGERSLLVDV